MLLFQLTSSGWPAWMRRVMLEEMYFAGAFGLPQYLLQQEFPSSKFIINNSFPLEVALSMASPSNVLRYLNHAVVTKSLWKQDLAFLSCVSISANHMLVPEVMGADAFFGSHADGRVQKASAGCFPILANISGQQSCLSSLSYSTCKPEILCTMLMRMGEDFSCPGNRLSIIVFLCPCKICSADGVERKRPLQK